jgi:hypothetical protein
MPEQGISEGIFFFCGNESLRDGHVCGNSFIMEIKAGCK